MPVEYDLEIQAKLPAAPCTLPNFTRDHDPNIGKPDNNGPDINHVGVLGRANLEAEGLEAEGLRADNAEAAEMRNTIAEHMWEDYQNYLQDHQDEYEEEEEE